MLGWRDAYLYHRRRCLRSIRHRGYWLVDHKFGLSKFLGYQLGETVCGRMFLDVESARRGSGWPALPEARPTSIARRTCEGSGRWRRELRLYVQSLFSFVQSLTGHRPDGLLRIFPTPIVASLLGKHLSLSSVSSYCNYNTMCVSGIYN